MVRTYDVMKKTYPEVEEEDVKKAMQLVLEEKLSVRQAAVVCGVKHTTLFYRMKKIKIEPSDLDNPRPTQLKLSVPIKKFASKYSSNQVPVGIFRGRGKFTERVFNKIVIHALRLNVLSRNYIGKQNLDD